MLRNAYLISTTSIFGGGEIYQIRLAKLLADRVIFTVLSQTLPQLKHNLVQAGANFVDLGPVSGIKLRASILQWLWRHRRKLRDDGAAIVLNGRGAAYLAPLIRCFGLNNLITIRHTAMSVSNKDVKERLYGIAVHFCRCVVAVSDSLAQEHSRLWPKVNVVPIRNWLPPKNGMPEKKRMVSAAVVARLAPGKGIEDIMAAWDGLETHLHIYGDGPMRAELAALAAGNSKFSFVGHVDDLSLRLASHSMLISASHSESFSYAVAEAFQEGLLCVLSDIPAHREMVGPDYSQQLFFRVGDIAALRESLKFALDIQMENEGMFAVRNVNVALKRINERNSSQTAQRNYLNLFRVVE